MATPRLQRKPTTRELPTGWFGFKSNRAQGYAHLNRAWFKRNVAEDFPDSDWQAASAFPADIEPIG